MDGWIKIHRKITDWEWYTDVNTTRLFIHLLLTASNKERQWKGKTLQLGVIITTVADLARETNLTDKQVRIALDKLCTTGEVGKQTTNKFTMITICNYESYQVISEDKGQTKGKQGANKGQTTIVCQSDSCDAISDPQNEKRANKTKENETENIPPVPPIKEKDKEKGQRNKETFSSFSYNPFSSFSSFGSGKEEKEEEKKGFYFDAYYEFFFRGYQNLASEVERFFAFNELNEKKLTQKNIKSALTLWKQNPAQPPRADKTFLDFWRQMYSTALWSGADDELHGAFLNEKICGCINPAHTAYILTCPVPVMQHIEQNLDVYRDTIHSLMRAQGVEHFEYITF